MNFRTKLLAIGFIIILSTSAAVYYYLDTLNPDDETPEDDIPGIDLQASVDSIEALQYRGDSFPTSVGISVNDTITVNTLEFVVQDTKYNRIGRQNITVDTIFEAGDHRLNVSISPAFSLGDGVVISEIDQNYPLLNFTVFYNTTQFYSYSSSISDISLEAMDPAVYDQAQEFVWNTTTTGETLNAIQGSVELSASTQTNFTLSTSLNTTGYTRLDINDTSSLATISYSINGTIISVIDDSYIPLGIYQGVQNLTITGQIEAGGDLDLKLQLLTKSVTLFAAIANNNWAGMDDDEFNFKDPGFYVELVSFQFKRIFNVTLIPSVTVDVATPESVEYDDIISDVLGETGTKLGLTNNTWKPGTGTFDANKGYDIILFFTNVTMEYLGIVYGGPSGALNLAFHSRGSLNAGTWRPRLPPSLADNLVQHEISHIFGAPDRFNPTPSTASVMTKSTPEDAFSDFLSGQFWLFLTNWLENDIQSMTDTARTLYWQ